VIPRDKHPPDPDAIEFIKLLPFKLKEDVVTDEPDTNAIDPPFDDDTLFVKSLLVKINMVVVCVPELAIEIEPPLPEATQSSNAVTSTLIVT
jgi:hypothetical protein